MQTLIVDDEALERKGIRYLIEQFGYDMIVHECANGLSASRFLAEKPVDILITDLKMPFMDGIELARLARNRYPEIKIILYSAYSQFEYAKTAIELGVVHYIVKPINCQEFKSAMDKLLQSCCEERRQRALLEEYERIRNLTSGSGQIAGDVVDAVIRIIEKRYCDILTLDGVAGELFLSPGYLSHRFKEQTGLTFTRYLTQYRLSVAAHLLQHSRMKAGDISHKVGFHNPSYFGERFREQFGCSPQAYRLRQS